MLVALCPQLLASSGVAPLQTLLTHDLHATRFGIELGSSLSDAGYALGAVIAVDLIQRFSQRPMFVATQIVFAVGGVLSATASGPWLYGAGRVIDGLATGLLLVLALPPLVTTFGAQKVPATMAVVNIGLFGAAAGGPLVAAGVVATGAWRALFWGLAVVGAAGALLTWRTLPERPGANPDQALNLSVFPLAVIGTVLPFFGAVQLVVHPFASPLVWAPLAVGVAGLVTLVVSQYRRRAALIPVRLLSTTLPVGGSLCAMIGGAAFVLCLGVVQLWMTDVVHRPAIDGAVLLWPATVGVAIAAAAFALALRTRLLVLLVAVGMVCLGLGAGLLLLLGRGGHQSGLILLVALLIGAGAGMTVAPGLFTAALSAPSAEVGRAVGLVELLRAEAAFGLSPVLAHFAMRHGSAPTAILGGLRFGSWAAMAAVAGGLLALGSLLVSGRVAPQRPDIDTWLSSNEPALGSPRIGEAVRQPAEPRSA
jgi:MFS family permease